MHRREQVPLQVHQRFCHRWNLAVEHKGIHGIVPKPNEAQQENRYHNGERRRQHDAHKNASMARSINGGRFINNLGESPEKLSRKEDVQTTARTG